MCKLCNCTLRCVYVHRYLRSCPFDRDNATMSYVIIIFQIPWHSKICNLLVNHSNTNLAILQTHFANIVFCEENISGSKVSVDETLIAEVVHATSNITSKSQQEWRNKLVDTFTFPIVCDGKSANWGITNTLAWLIPKTLTDLL